MDAISLLNTEALLKEHGITVKQKIHNFDDSFRGHTLGVVVGIYDDATDTFIDHAKHLTEEQMRILMAHPDVIKHYLTQIDEKTQDLRTRHLICLPYARTDSTHTKPTCIKPVFDCEVTAEIILIEDNDLRRTFTMSFHTCNIPIVELVTNALENLYDNKDIDDWRKENGIDIKDKKLFCHYDETDEYEEGIGIDYYDDIGTPYIVTYPSGDYILSKIQSIRVIDVTYD